jgi:diacylglycerol kinase family enzyme
VQPGTKRAEFKAAFQGIAAGLGAHTELPFVEYIKCTGFTIQPEATKGETAVCVDGEIYNLLSRARLKVAIHGEKLQIYA